MATDFTLILNFEDANNVRPEVSKGTFLRCLVLLQNNRGNLFFVDAIYCNEYEYYNNDTEEYCKTSVGWYVSDEAYENVEFITWGKVLSWVEFPDPENV